MPCYDYLCTVCKHRWEVSEPAESSRKRSCPKCRAKARRLFPCPAIRTDATFLAGRKMLGDQMPMKDLKFRIAQARQHGYKPSPNDMYDPCLAQFAGDPKGFIPADNARSHVRRVCEGMGVANSDVGAKQGMSRLEPPVRLAPKLVEEKRRRMIAQDPSLAHKDQRELQEAIVEKYSRKPSTT